MKIPTDREIAVARSHDCLISDHIHDYVDTAEWARRAMEELVYVMGQLQVAAVGEPIRPERLAGRIEFLLSELD